jgi:hypothetical protein
MTQDSCRFCNVQTLFFSNARILKYSAEYFKCPNCSSVQVVNPFWLEEAHSSAISTFDTGLAARCISAANLIGTLLRLEGKERVAGIDWAGGTGLLTRLLRDQGFQTLSHDKYAHPVHSVGFIATDAEARSKADFISAIECIEHLENPIEEIREFTEFKEYFFFTIEIISPRTPDPLTMEWWYYLPESGQHITFPSLKGIGYFKARLGFDYHYSIGSIQVFSRKKLKLVTRLVFKHRIIRRLFILVIPLLNCRKDSLTSKDQENLIENSMKNS